MQRLAPFVPVLFLAGLSAQQTQLTRLPERGVLSTVQAGIVFQGAGNRIALKTAGDGNVLDQYPDNSSGMAFDLRIAAVEAWVQQQSSSNWVANVDGITTSNDVLRIVHVTAPDGETYYRVYTQFAAAWAMLEMVTEGDPNVAAGDIVGYYPGNPGFPFQLRNQYYYEILGAEFNNGTYTLPAGQPAIQAMDVGLGLLEASDSLIQEGVIEFEDRLYFSLTPASATALDATGVVDTTLASQAGFPFDGSTIFQALYDGNGDVFDVVVYKTSDELGLSPQADIDALAMGVEDPAAFQPTTTTANTLVRIAPGTEFFILSLAAADPDDQLMVVAQPLGSIQTIAVLRDEQGNALVGPGRPITGNIRGVCAQDPESSGAIITQSMAIPAFEESPINWIGASLFAEEVSINEVNPANIDAFRIHGMVSGWGPAAPKLSFMGLEVTLNGVSTLYSLPFREPGTDNYTFSKDLMFPLDGMNNYQLRVVQLPVSGANAVYSTYPMLLNRRQLP